MESIKIYNTIYQRWEWRNSQRQLHREDGPAIEYNNGDKYWQLNGFMHREDGPAIEYANGDKYWYLNGRRHRENGPAIEYVDGGKEYYLNGQRHREDGPAIEYISGHKEYWVHGVRIQSLDVLQDIKQKYKEAEIARKENESTLI